MIGLPDLGKLDANAEFRNNPFCLQPYVFFSSLRVKKVYEQKFSMLKFVGALIVHLIRYKKSSMKSGVNVSKCVSIVIILYGLSNYTLRNQRVFLAAD